MMTLKPLLLVGTNYAVLLSSLWRVVWKHWIYKCAYPVYILSSVCLRCGLFSPLSFMGLRDISWPISLLMIVGIFLLRLIISIKPEIWLVVVFSTIYGILLQSNWKMHVAMSTIAKTTFMIPYHSRQVTETRLKFTCRIDWYPIFWWEYNLTK